ncbi:uncharacterized protein LOC134466241 [Engraulis encrasicolus]|uniref:uncharacterized protein LOC134466241 n=1 Tax=Engraulis encrasicolus TaxID=184585 RepID=UPI002FD32FD8
MGKKRRHGHGGVRSSGKGDSMGPPGDEHCYGDSRKPVQAGPVPGKVVLLKRGLATSGDGKTTTTPAPKTPNKKLTPKKKVEWIPYTSSPASDADLDSVWLIKARMKATLPKEPSPEPPTDRLKHLSLLEPLLPLDIESSGAGEGSYLQGLRRPSWTESRAVTGSCGQAAHWESGWSSYSVGQGEDAEGRSESPDRGSTCYYSCAPASSEDMMPFRRKKAASRWPSVSWADDDYWASWDGWDEVIDWDDDSGPSRRRGGRCRQQAKRNAQRWGNKGGQR